jgi:hypothetical protein
MAPLVKKLLNSITADTVTAVATSIIALAALFVSVDQGCESRRHNRLSVRPAFSLIMNISRGNEQLGVFLINKGLGPGLVKEVQIKAAEKWLKVQSVKDWRNALQTIGLNVEWVKWTAIDNGTVISPNEHVALLAMIDTPVDESNKERFRSFLQNVQFRIRYESMYGDSFSEENP